jgi:hypothetical protein
VCATSALADPYVADVNKSRRLPLMGSRVSGRADGANSIDRLGHAG